MEGCIPSGECCHNYKQGGVNEFISDGVFGRFDLAALCGCHTLNFCLFVCS